jgi:hypothetical protein
MTTTKKNPHRQLTDDTVDLLNQLSIKLQAMDNFEKEHQQVGTPLNRVEDHKFLMGVKEWVDKVVEDRTAAIREQDKDKEEDDEFQDSDYYDSTCN